VALQVKWGGTSFLPATDSGNLMIEVRTPGVVLVEYARLKMERAAEPWPARLPETKETNSNINASGGRIYVDIGKRNTRSRSAKEIATELREKVRSLVGAEYTVLDDLNNGARKPIQIDFTGPDSRKLLEITSAYMDKLRWCRARWMLACRSKTPRRNSRSNSTAAWPIRWAFPPTTRTVPARGLCRYRSG
jgi:multidrug efflux pump subunit AcrB